MTTGAAGHKNPSQNLDKQRGLDLARNVDLLWGWRTRTRPSNLCGSAMATPASSTLRLSRVRRDRQFGRLNQLIAAGYGVAFEPLGSGAAISLGFLVAERFQQASHACGPVPSGIGVHVREHEASLDLVRGRLDKSRPSQEVDQPAARRDRLGANKGGRHKASTFVGACTRRHSESAAAVSGKKNTPKPHRTTSKESSATSRCSLSPTRTSTAPAGPSKSPRSWRASSIIVFDKSTPRTYPDGPTRSTATRRHAPLPLATSNTRWPGSSAAASTRYRAKVSKNGITVS